MATVEAPHEGEMAALLEDIYQHYSQDFRGYAEASLRRRVIWALRKLGLKNVAQLRAYITQAPQHFAELIEYMTVPVSSMFRDPDYFLALREHVIPVLRTYSSPKLWVAGCCAGEEAYSLAILLHEEGLLERTVIYATDINTVALDKAERGIFRIDRLQLYTENYQAAGGQAAFSDYYYAAYGHAVFDKFLTRNIVFAEHSLTTDSVFSEMQLISCRNVLIYFQRELQDRTFAMFYESLCRKGFLGLGSRETVDFSPHGHRFDNYVKGARIYQKNENTLGSEKRWNPAKSESVQIIA